MNDENLVPEDTNTPEPESAEAKLRAAIKKFSYYSKTNQKTEWWDKD